VLKLSVAYLLLYEIVFCLMSGAIGLLGLMFRDLSFPDRAFGGWAMFAALVSLWAIVAVVRKSRYWFQASLAVCIIAFVASSYFIWSGVHADSNGDGREAVLFGLTLLLFGIPAIGLLFLSSTRRYMEAAKT
jgi:hypothetical protein